MFCKADGVRKVPSQSRSRERQERILDVAERLIAAAGFEALKMGDIAKEADISVGSLYQYYQDRSAVLSALAERYHAEGSACIMAFLAEVRTPDELKAVFGQLVAEYYGLFQARPAMRDVWAAIQADKSLAYIELDATRRNAGLLSEAISRVNASRDKTACASSAFAIMALGEAAMRLAIAVPPPEARTVIEVYQRMTQAELSALLADG